MNNKIEGAQRVEVQMNTEGLAEKNTTLAEIQSRMRTHTRVVMTIEGDRFIIQGSVDVYPAVGKKIIISPVRDLAKILEAQHALVKSITADGKEVWTNQG